MINLFLAILQSNLLLAKYLNVLSSTYHRFFSNWQILDLATLILLHIVLIAILFFIFKIINSKHIKALLTICYLLCFITYPAGLDPITLGISFLLLSICILSIPVSRSYLISNNEKILQALTVASIVFISSFYYTLIFKPAPKFTSSYSQELKVENKNTKQPNVFFFIFDRMSYLELYERNKKTRDVMSDEYPNFKEFSEHSWNFHSAFSAFQTTLTSIPIIFGLDKDKNLIDFFKEREMSTHILGHYMNYCDLFKNLNSCLATNFFGAQAHSNKFISSTMQHLAFLPNTWDLLFDEHPPKYIRHRLFKRKAYREQKLLEKEVLSFLKTKPQNSFVYIHFNPPHSPHIYTRDGLGEKDLFKKNLFKLEPDKSLYRYTMEEYRNNIYYADTLFGKYMNLLKEEGLYNDSIIILSSDHAYHNYWQYRKPEDDYYATKAREEFVKRKKQNTKDLENLLLCTHVPLMIKLAKQTEKKDSEVFITNSLLFSEDNKALFDSNLSFSEKRIKQQKDNLVRLPKFSHFFPVAQIKNDQIIHKSRF